MSDWEDQWKRAQRSYERFKTMNDGFEPNMPSENYIDDAMAFFTFCYHVKDYLKHDPAFTKQPKGSIETYVNSTPALSLCGDICNGIKHLKLTNLRTADQPKLGKREFYVSVTHSLSGEKVPDEMKIKLAIEHDGKTHDAFQVATDAMQAWEAFLK